MTDVCPVVHFDHHGPDFAANPWPQLSELRAGGTLAWSEVYGGFWVVTSYEDIKTIALDDHTFSSSQTILIPPKQNAKQKSIPIETDPPLFLEYRRVMQPLFTPAAVDRLEPAIETFVNRAIDEFIETGECDLVHDVADPVPAMTTLHKLGLPITDWARFAEPLHKTVFLRQGNPRRDGVIEQLGWIKRTVTEAIAERKHSPRDDMISYMLNASVDGRPLTDEEVGEMVMLTIQGGFDTTGSAISSALLHLDRDRDLRQELIDDPALIPVAIEEFLRFEAPQFALARVATRDVDVGGCPVKEGDRLLLVWASGNRDESVFPDADSLVLDRYPNRHMTFGLGAHRCLGSTLARRQIILTVRAVLRRMPDYRVDHARVERAETIGVTYGCFAMPATFGPGPRNR